MISDDLVDQGVAKFPGPHGPARCVDAHEMSSLSGRPTVSGRPRYASGSPGDGVKPTMDRPVDLTSRGPCCPTSGPPRDRTADMLLTPGRSLALVECRNVLMRLPFRLWFHCVGWWLGASALLVATALALVLGGVAHATCPPAWGDLGVDLTPVLGTITLGAAKRSDPLTRSTGLSSSDRRRSDGALGAIGGCVLKLARISAGLSQEAFAELLHVSLDTVQGWESGRLAARRHQVSGDRR
ncbi:MAG: helix-turn-helix domain-containing protein [Pseudonocardiales bacterium]